jgi:hypothetical protein
VQGRLEGEEEEEAAAAPGQKLPQRPANAGTCARAAPTSAPRLRGARVVAALPDGVLAVPLNSNSRGGTMTVKLRIALLLSAVACLVATGAPAVQASAPDSGSASAAKPCKTSAKKKQKKKGKRAKRATCGSVRQTTPPPPPPAPPAPPIWDCEALVAAFPSEFMPCE